MTFRTRLLIAFLLAVLLPMVALALFVRNEMTNRLMDQYARRVTSLVTVMEEDLAQESEVITTSLAALSRAIVDDNSFRRAVIDRTQEERRYLLDYAGNAMQLTGLSMLQIQNEAGRIVSSGHFRNEYDRLEPELPKLLASTPEGIALVQARAPDAPFLALAGVDSFQMGGRQFTIVAGIKMEPHFLSRLEREAELTVSLIYPGGTLTSSTDMNGHGSGAPRDTVVAGEVVRELSVQFIDSVHGELAPARIHITHRNTELHDLRRSVDHWFLIAVAATAVLSVILANWLASRISRPLEELAGKTSRIDLDRLDIDFRTHRRDEIGALSRLLGAMTERLRVSAGRIKDAERRATLGELARQVNHDIKNGLIPIRNVFRHLTQMAREAPGHLPEVFGERQHTIDSSICYLENLAANYARLYPHVESRSCDVNAIIRRVVENMRGPGHVNIKMNLTARVTVLGDPVALRRIVENLVDNAIDSLETKPGTVRISTSVVSGEAGVPKVRIIVADTGTGMSEEQLAKVFDDFYTTKENGTGLGLSIIRRLVIDLGGSIHVKSEEGNGSRFIIDLPGQAGVPDMEEAGSND